LLLSTRAPKPRTCRIRDREWREFITQCLAP